MRSCLCCCVAQLHLSMYMPIAGGCYSEKIYLVEGGKSLFMAYLNLLIMFLISLSLCSGVVQDVLIVGGLF